MSTIIKKKTFPNYRKYSMDLAGRPLTLEVGTGHRHRRPPAPGRHRLLPPERGL